MQAVNDNIDVKIFNDCCIVICNNVKITFYKILEAKAFIDDYHERTL